MNRFKASKFKNATPKVPKKTSWITEISAGSLLNSYGTYIDASCKLLAFNVDVSGGKSLAVLPLNDCGRKERTMPLLHAHSGFVSDFCFSPFDDYLLATCSFDCTAKLWQLPEGGITEPNMAVNSTVITEEQARIESVCFNPAANNILAMSVQKTVKVFDLVKVEQKYDLNGHQDSVQAMTWKSDGSLLGTYTKDKKIRVFDPRTTQDPAMEFDGFGGQKDAYVKWRGETDHIIGTGASKMRSRLVAVWDVKNTSRPLETLEVDNGLGTLIPFYDEDTDMLLLGGKGDSLVIHYDITDSAPLMTLAFCDRLEEQTKGMGMVPKRALDVMSCEVVRLLQLTKNSVVPVSFCVPRKSYRDFHGDLFPDTRSGEAAMSAEEWFNNENKPMKRETLDPAKRPKSQEKHSDKKSSPRPAQGSENAKPKERQLQPKPVDESQPNPQEPQPKPQEPQRKPEEPQSVCQEPKPREPQPKPQEPQAKPQEPQPKSQEPQAKPQEPQPQPKPQEPQLQKAAERKPEDSSAAAKKKAGGKFFIRTSKVRHVQGKLLHKSTFIENIRNMSISTPGDSDGFCGNEDFVVVPLAGPGGQLAVFDLNKPGRLPDTGVPVIQNSSTAMDYMLSPFDTGELAVACDDGSVRIWKIPQNGLTQTLDKPFCRMTGHNDKLNMVKYHTTAEHLLATASYDLTVKLWDMEKAQDCITLTGHPDPLSSMAWKKDGELLATVCKDKKIRLFDPRSHTAPVMEGNAPEGLRGARICWVGPGCDWLLVSGFARGSTRVINLYDTRNEITLLNSLQLDTSPATLIPFFDEGTGIVYLTGKGDTKVFCFEVADDSPHLFELAHFVPGGAHQAFVFLNKSRVNVREVEVDRALRFTKTTVEPVQFTIPRVKPEFFQDDLFPDTVVSWEPALSCASWLNGENKVQRKISLQPADMTKLCDAPQTERKVKRLEQQKEIARKTDSEKKDELLASMVNRVSGFDEPLPQELVEGVDDEEWDE